MATVMTSRQPPLPARQRSEPHTTHITYKQPTQASKQFQHTVQYQPSTQSGHVTHVKLAHSSSDVGPPVFEPNRAPPSGRRASEPAAPPLPRRNPEQVNHPIRKRSIETNSFIDRNTAKIFSDPERARRPVPALPSTPETQSKTLPRGHTTSSHYDDTPPPIPGSLPPRGRPIQHQQQQDFESRFRFHGPSEFPDPDVPTAIPKKAYPSASIKRKHHQHTKNHEASLDPL